MSSPSPAADFPQALKAQRRPLAVLKTTEIIASNEDVSAGASNEDVSAGVCVSSHQWT